MKEETKKALQKALVTGAIGAVLFAVIDSVVVQYESWWSVALGTVVFFVVVGGVSFWMTNRKNKRAVK